MKKHKKGQMPDKTGNYVACINGIRVDKAIFGMENGEKGLICLQEQFPAIKSAPMLHTHPSFFRWKSHPAGQTKKTVHTTDTILADHPHPFEYASMKS